MSAWKWLAGISSAIAAGFVVERLSSAIPQRNSDPRTGAKTGDTVRIAKIYLRPAGGYDLEYAILSSKLATLPDIVDVDAVYLSNDSFTGLIKGVTTPVRGPLSAVTSVIPAPAGILS